MMAEANRDAPASRKRGRPRTVTDDEQAPERRRKQLRVAQQVYRRRKETTIVNLQTRLQELESGIEKLSQSFLSFSKLLFEANVFEKHPRVTSAFHEITQQCVSLARKGCDEPDQGGPADAVPNTSRKLNATQNINQNYDTVIAQPDTLLMIDGTAQPSLATRNQCPVSQSPPTPPKQEQAIDPFSIVLLSPTIPFSSIPRPSLASLPTTISPSSLEQGPWTLSHRLVRDCYEIGYRLLINSSGNDPKVHAIFGKQLNISKRNRMISGFYAAMHGEPGDMIELSTKALSPLQPMRNTYSPEQLAISPPPWQTDIESGYDEWLDASEVQKLLLEKGIQVLDTSSPDFSPRFTSSYQLNVVAFIRLLSLSAICVGRGPAFRKRDIENALHLTTSDGPWSMYTNDD